jgi:hypothetical protein
MITKKYFSMLIGLLLLCSTNATLLNASMPQHREKKVTTKSSPSKGKRKILVRKRKSSERKKSPVKHTKVITEPTVSENEVTGEQTPAVTVHVSKDEE